MVFIVGGREQGKEEFAGEQFPVLENKKLVDGSRALWEEFLKAYYAINLQEMIRRRLEEGEALEVLEQEMAGQLFAACPERVLVADEIGCGIVPADKFSRDYRELTGRICCQLAQKSREVWRVTAGIGQRIK